jgi:hypothetical protein
MQVIFRYGIKINVEKKIRTTVKVYGLFLKKITLKKTAYFSKVYYHKTFQTHQVCGAGEDPASLVCISTNMLLVILLKKAVSCWG